MEKTTAIDLEKILRKPVYSKQDLYDKRRKEVEAGELNIFADNANYYIGNGVIQQSGVKKVSISILIGLVGLHQPNEVAESDEDLEEALDSLPKRD